MVMLSDVLARVSYQWQDLIGQYVWGRISLDSELKNDPMELGEYVIDATNEGRDLLIDKKKRDNIISLLHNDEASGLAASLELSYEGSPYVALRNAKYSQKRIDALFDYFGIPLFEKDECEDKPDSVTIQPGCSLYSYQKDVLVRAARLYNKTNGNNNFMIHMPTGSGKTRVAMNLISRILMESTSGVVLWMAYSEELCEQAVDEFTRVWSLIGDREITVERMFEKHDYSDISDGLLVAGLDKLRSKSKSDPTFLGKLAKKLILVVFDEAHQSIADTYYQMLSEIKFFKQECAIVGLSATPGRTDDSETKQLSKLFGNNKITLNIPGYSSPIKYLYEEGFLSVPTFIELKCETPIEDLVEGLDYSQKILKALGVTYVRNQMIADKIEECIKRGHKRILVFTPSVEGAKLLSIILKRKNIDSTEITAETNPDIRAKRIKNFKTETDNPMVLCNFGVLTTGFDAPKTTAVIIARPTKSLILYSQMVGRALRGVRMHGTKTADIITVVDINLPGFGSVIEAFKNWDRDWNEQ